MIPMQIRQLDQWVCWTVDKMPKNPHTGGNAQSNNPSTWGSYQQAEDACKRYGFSGVGFMFASGYFGVDLDAHNGEILSDDLKNEFISTLQSYAEISKSGNGIHIICKGSLPAGARRKGQIEMYDTGRYFIMTGNVCSNYTEIVDCTETIKSLHAKYLRKEQKEVINRKEVVLELSESAIIDKARNAASGTAFQLLYSGNWQGLYPSQSEADLAFCNMLAFWCARDFNMMDSIMRSSGLMRPKWDRAQGNTTYGKYTLNRAIDDCTEVYDPSVVTDEALPQLVVSGSRKNDTKKQVYDLTDSGNGKRFCDMFQNDVKFNNISKTWHYWDGKTWKTDQTKYIKNYADLCIKAMKQDAFNVEDETRQKAMLKNASAAQSMGKKKAMLEEASHLLPMVALPEDFDKYKDLLNASNGVINLKNGELIKHSPHFMQSKILHCSTGAEHSALWLKFIDEITCGDKALASWLQKAVGYTFSGSTEEQVVFFLFGAGGNGKSVFVDIIAELLGQYSINVQPEVFMEHRGQQNNETQMARLKGVRMVTSAEFKEGMINESLIKQVSGGGMMTARHLYGEPFDFEPEFKLWITTNNKPIIKGTDNGIWRRIKLIPFLANIAKEQQDKKLKDKLRTEIDKILYWCIEGAIRWSAEGLGECETVENMTKEYRNEMDVLSTFLEQSVVPENGNFVKASDLFAEYLKWAKENNEWEMTSTRFGREMSKRYDKKRKGDGVIYENIRLVNQQNYGRFLGK